MTEHEARCYAQAIEDRRVAEAKAQQAETELDALRLQLAGLEDENRQLKATIIIVNKGRAA